MVMKTIIAGSRGIDEYQLVVEAVEESGWFKDITEVVSGGARGPDRLGEMWAKYHQIPIKLFPADWDRLGRGAGHIRNAQMADYADALIAVYDGHSRGTANMIQRAKSKGLKVYVKTIQ